MTTTTHPDIHDVAFRSLAVRVLAVDLGQHSYDGGILANPEDSEQLPPVNRRLSNGCEWGRHSWCEGREVLTEGQPWRCRCLCHQVHGDQRRVLLELGAAAE